MPLAASITMIGRVHRRQRAVGVVGKVLVAGRIEQVEDVVASYSKVITDVTTEMPRSRSIFIQSERVWMRSFLAFTSPASWIAPPNSSSFSVNVVLPASGWAI
jgi:hypothetical protein